MKARTVQIMSDTTCSLVEQLVKRDQAGKIKYGTSLDRTDFTVEQWLQHQVEELLDAAGYATAAMREIQKLREENDALRASAREYSFLRKEITQAMGLINKNRYYRGPGVQEGIDLVMKAIDHALHTYDSAAVLRQLRKAT